VWRFSAKPSGLNLQRRKEHENTFAPEHGCFERPAYTAEWEEIIQGEALEKLNCTQLAI
jgi:hypothetical protein